MNQANLLCHKMFVCVLIVDKKKMCSHSQSHKSKTVISLRVFVFLIRASVDRVILVRVSNRVLCQKEYKTFIFSGMFFLFFLVWQFKSPRAICRRWKNNFCRCLAPSARTAVNLQSDTICDEVLACCICHLFSICLWLMTLTLFIWASVRESLKFYACENQFEFRMTIFWLFVYLFGLRLIHIVHSVNIWGLN